MKRTNYSTDGFMRRRSSSHLGDLHDKKPIKRVSMDTSTGITRAGDQETGSLTPREISAGGAIVRSEISSFLQQIDKGYDEPKKKRSLFGRRTKNNRKNKKPRSKIRQFIKWFGIILVFIILCVGGYLAFKAIYATSNILIGSIFDLAKTQPLKQDANGRSNFLILGTTDDDPNHAGGALTDSILVLSIDQTKKDAFIFSVPRDLYVQYGSGCLSGYRGKINVYFSCVNDGTNNAEEQDRLAKTQSFIGNILGMDIQYGVHIRSGALGQAVDAVGGIDIDIEGSNGAPGILDRNFDWGCNYTCYKVKYDNGVHHLNGAQVSFLSMARGDTAPTYGLANSNFDREKNQQKILIAIKNKAVSSGTISDISKVTKLIDAFGNNFRTNVETKEIRTILELAKDIPSDKIQTIDLYKTGEAQFTTKTVDGAGSVVLPAAGQFVYTYLQAYLNKVITQEPFVKELPHVTVLNGSGTAGMAQIEADKLTAKGFIVDTVNNAPDTTNGSAYPAVTIYQLTDKKPLSATKLKTLYGVTLNTTKPPVSVVGATDFLIIIGPSQ